MKCMFLDDDPNRQRIFKSNVPCAKQVWTADQTIEAINEVKEIGVLFLDHDLGGEVYVDSSCHNTGMTVAKWLAKNPRKISHVVIHSFNPVGAKNMANELKGKYNIHVLPFLSDEFNSIVQQIR